MAPAPTVDVTAIAVVLVTTLAGASILWAARCGLVFHRLEREVDKQLEDHQAAQEKRLADALALILRACLPDLLDLYFTQGFVGPAPITPKALRTAAGLMEKDPDAGDLHAHREVTRPVSIALVNGIIKALPELAPKLSNQEAPYEGLLRLRCFIGPYEEARGQARVLAWRFGAQCLALPAVVALAPACLLQKIEPLPVVVVAVIVVAHGLMAELSLHGLSRRIAVLPPLVKAGVR